MDGEAPRDVFDLKLTLEEFICNRTQLTEVSLWEMLSDMIRFCFEK